MASAEQAMVPAITTRAPDDFYDPPPDRTRARGQLLRSEPLLNATLPLGMQGWRILYTTTVDDRTPATAAATVFAPLDPPPGLLPVILWEHGTTGLGQKCMPSLASSPAEGIPGRDRIAAAGWAIVATDYSFVEPGGPHPYLIGEAEARAALDGLRAARQMSELTLASRTVVWGHSQGGHAALWTGIVARRYAPDVEIAGVAAIAPAADIGGIFARNAEAERRLGPYIAAAYSRFYPNVAFERAVRPEALNAAREIGSLCNFLPPEDAQRIAALAASFTGPALSTDPALAARIRENTAGGEVLAPLLVAQGLDDTVVPSAATEAFVAWRCTARQRLDYWTFAELDHGAIVGRGSPLEAPLLAWTTARFAEERQAPGCARRFFVE